VFRAIDVLLAAHDESVRQFGMNVDAVEGDGQDFAGDLEQAADGLDGLAL
jgi:hypothetical protein